MNFETILLEDFEAFADQSFVRVVKKKVPEVKNSKPVEAYPCPNCNLKYKGAYYLKAHIKSKSDYYLHFTTYLLCNKFAGIDLGTYFD